nr:FAD-binding oxidoreductase [Haloprofundus salilacus]
MLPDEDGYNEARTVWNAMIDRYPAIIVRALGAADVMQAVGFARDHDLEIAIKGGGHNVAGYAVCDNGLMLDLSKMRSVRVDSESRTARVEPGAVLHDVDQETQAHGLVVPGGFVSSTGIAGLTLGGGFGYLSRKYGLTVDSLRSVDLVTADGELVRASEDENPDLFWGLRGGGGNFGVVTSFEFDLHDLSPTVLAGPVAHTFEDAPQVMREVAAVMHEAPDNVSCLMAIRHAPPAPFLPQEIHGERILLIAMIYAGDPNEGKTALGPLREIGDPVADAVGPKPYTAFQSTFDAANAEGARNYWKSHYAELSDEVIDVLCEHAERLPTPESTIGMLALGGEISRQSADSAPYPHRDAPWVLNLQARWREPEDERSIKWSRELFDALTPHASGGVYVNFITETDDKERIRAAYGEEVYDRLAALKAEWDPENRFHLNQNIEPTV